MIFDYFDQFIYHNRKNTIRINNCFRVNSRFGSCHNTIKYHSIKLVILYNNRIYNYQTEMIRSSHGLNISHIFLFHSLYLIDCHGMLFISYISSLINYILNLISRLIIDNYIHLYYYFEQLIQTELYLELLYILSQSYPSLYLSIYLIILIKYSLYFKRQQTRKNQNSTRNLLSFHPSITFLLFVKCLLWNWYCWMEI